MNNFASKIARFATRAVGRLTVVKRHTLKKLSTSVFNDTPVLTGRLQGSWRWTKGSPVVTVAKPIDSRIPVATLVASVDEVVGVGDGHAFLGNFQPYAARIEYEGHSRKAPAGMLRINLARADWFVKTAAAETEGHGVAADITL